MFQSLQRKFILLKTAQSKCFYDFYLGIKKPVRPSRTGLIKHNILMVGVTGFEPATPSPPD